MKLRHGRLRWLVVLLLFLPQTVLAQSEEPQPSAILFQPNLDGFPNIQVFMDVRDASNNFIHNLQEDQLTLQENDLQITEYKLREIRPGAQVVLAVLPGPTFAIRNAQGMSRYDAVSEVLRNWLSSRQGSTIDDWSLLVNGGAQTRHEANPTGLLTGLTSEGQDFRQATPNLDAAFQAVELAADPSLRPGMGRAVLLVTAPLDQQSPQSLDNLEIRARELGVRIFIWMIGSPEGVNRSSVERLEEIARQTGGTFLAFEGEGALPSPEDYVDPLRETYQINYASQVRSSGIHQLIATVQIGQDLITTPPLTFKFDIQPPIPAFVQPPLEIERVPAEPGNNTSTQPGQTWFLPNKQPLQIVVDFPDGWSRALKSSSLFVDGIATQVNNQAPFDRFEWNLEPYLTDEGHILSVEVADNLGMVGRSGDHLVQVTVVQPTNDAFIFLQNNYKILLALVVSLGGAFLFLALILAGRLRPHPPGQRQLQNPKPPSQASMASIETKRNRLIRLGKIQRPQRHMPGQAVAFLVRLEKTADKETILALETDQKSARFPPPASSIPITTEQSLIGSDPKIASILLSDASIEGYHAKLTHQADGSFFLSDAGSTAGTWINFCEVGPEGAVVSQGDVIHFGRLWYRFVLRNPPQPLSPVVLPLPPFQHRLEVMAARESPQADHGIIP